MELSELPYLPDEPEKFTFLPRKAGACTMYDTVGGLYPVRLPGSLFPCNVRSFYKKTDFSMPYRSFVIVVLVNSEC